MLIYKKGKFDLHPSSKIIIKGTLGFNYKHSKKDPFPSYLEMSEDAVLQVDKGCTIYSNSYIYIGKNAKLKLGSGYINRGAKISCYASISIGERVIIAEGVTIRDSDNHQIVSSDHKMTQEIIIENNVWIGINATILKGVRIGEGSIVAAGAVVTKSVPPHSIVAGVPARVIKDNVSWK